MNSYTETCMSCGSTNRIPPYRPDAMAFTCWNCNENCWLDHDACQRYKVLNNIEHVQAAMDLDNNKVPMVDGEFNG